MSTDKVSPVTTKEKGKDKKKDEDEDEDKDEIKSICAIHIKSCSIYF